LVCAAATNNPVVTCNIITIATDGSLSKGPNIAVPSLSDAAATGPEPTLVTAV